MIKKLAQTSFITIILLLNSTISSAIDYEQGDWVGYTNFKYITSIAADQRVVYFGTTGGIIRYDRFMDKWLYPLTTTGGLPSNKIHRLAYEPNYDELWALTDKGAAKYNITFAEWYPASDFPDSLVRNSWTPSRFTSLFTPFGYDYMNGYITDPYMRRFSIMVGFEDIDDLMYIGTWGLGPAILNTRYQKIELMPFGPFNYNISRLIRIGNDIWMGSDYMLSEKAITKYSLDTQEWEYFEPEFVWGLNSSELTSGIQTGNHVWLGTPEGLVRINGNNSLQTFSSLPSRYILSLAEYGGFIYAGTKNGLGIVPTDGDMPDSSFKTPLSDEYHLRGFQVNDLLKFNGCLYIATHDGAFCYDSTHLKFRKIDTPTHDLAYGVNDIFSDGRYLYFGARFGVVIIDVRADTSSVATDHSYADRWQINEVCSNDKYIWAATSIGLWRYRKADEETRLYTTADGLPTDYINSLIIDGNYLWLGTSRGMVRFLWDSPGRGD
ncbi:MAG: hypothetical protein J7K40_13420 [candidate division Zixibacteria bacterium]|nr:hypothetical protein [candidate division Zixibacteria bacterium]